jgi:hypothetical protein
MHLAERAEAKSLPGWRRLPPLKEFRPSLPHKPFQEIAT